MKTIRIFAFAAVLPVVFACTKVNSAGGDTTNQSGNCLTITVSPSENPINDETKATFEDGKGIIWVAGDYYAGIIKKEPDWYTAQSKALSNVYAYNGGGDGSQASFSFDMGTNEGNYQGDFKFFYPYYGGAHYVAENGRLELPVWIPNEQTSSAGKSSEIFAVASHGMLTITANHDIGASVKYDVIGSYVRFNFKNGREGELVRRIDVKGGSAADNLCGTYYVNGEDNTLLARTKEGEANYLYLTVNVSGNCDVTADQGVYAAFRPGEHKPAYTVITNKGIYRMASAAFKPFNFGSIKQVTLNLADERVNPLYLVGNASTAGWIPENAIEMTKTPTGYKLENVLLKSDGEFAFLTEKSWEGTLRNSGANSSFYYSRDSGNGSEKNFSVDKGGYYDLTVDFATMTVKAELKSAFPWVKTSDATATLLPVAGQDGVFKGVCKIGGSGNHDFRIYASDAKVVYPASGYDGAANVWFSNNIYNDDTWHDTVHSGASSLAVAQFDAPHKVWYVEDNWDNHYYEFTYDTNANTVDIKLAQTGEYWLVGEKFGNWKKDDAYKSTAAENGVVTWNVTTDGSGAFYFAGGYENENYFSTNASGNNFGWSWDGGNQYGRTFQVYFRDNLSGWWINEGGNFTITFDTVNLTISVVKN